MSRERVPSAMRRLPRLVYRDDRRSIVEPDARAGAAALSADFAVLDELLEPTFQRLDAAALRAQNSYRLLRLVLILGAALATLLGTWQAASDGSAWAGLAEGVVGAGLAGVTALLQARGFHRRYLSARLGAERLRSEYFLFLARAGEYTGAAPASRLKERVLRIEQEAGG
ncbi:MAG TPA: DUF4231 domain-containing protein [Thermoleophilaceae bacterium]|jgi:hypothetical protein